MSVEPTTPASSALANWLSGYASRPGLHDEMLAGAGGPRPHWESLLNSLAALGPAELSVRQQQALALISENGLTHNVFGDPRGVDRPWRFDVVPLPIGPTEWSAIEEGLIQRATLLDMVLSDLQGSQTLLKEGMVPPELVYATPAFLRACHDVPPAGGRMLHLYAAELNRAPDGTWWVLADHTGTPGGAGYALENRIVVSRVLPNIFRDCQVQRLATFFQTLRDHLISLAPQHRDQPRVVLLTGGPEDEHYFEHAFLARYLGYTLVEGGDLTVHDNHVCLKTLSGLQPVDVILRCVADTACDALELDQTAASGVPGLLQAARSGHVTITNSPGSGLIESAGFMPFLPGLCRHLLEEDLKLPSLATWWCGEPASLAHVLEHLDRLVIKPALAGTGTTVFADRLSAAQRRELADRIRSRPYAYVGQERALLSTVPVWTRADRLEPRPMILRTFLTASDDGYAILPGGLARVGNAPDTPVVAMHRGERSKDVWVLADGPVQPVSLLQSSGQPITLKRSAIDLPSRVADNLFWLGRYVERAEDVVRLLRIVMAELSEEAEQSDSPELLALLRALSAMGYLDPRLGTAAGLEDLPALEQGLLSAIFDEQRPAGVRGILVRVRRLAAMARDRMSMDTWRTLNHLDLHFYHLPDPGTLQLSDALAVLDGVIITLAAFSGLGMESMTRGQHWRFLDMGRRIERALHMLELIRHTLALEQPAEPVVLDAVLRVADSRMTYRSRYMDHLRAGPVLDLLLTDETNPRAVAFQLATLAEHVEELPRDRTDGQRTREQRIMIEALSRIRLADVEGLAHAEPGGFRGPLNNLLDELRHRLDELGSVITGSYLSHAEPPRSLTRS